jgi:transposase InsO family protein
VSCPGQTPVEVEEEVVRLRKQLCEDGLDAGATSIQWHLGRAGVRPVPSVATVHRLLVRRGLVTPQPRKRPKSSWTRFEADAPNERWQIDAMDWVTAAGVVRVFNIVDDHSRLLIASRAVPEATTAQAWTTFTAGAQRWGLPAGVLSDNGLCFSGRLRGHEVLFEANLRDAGIRPMTGAPYHPQTTGKVERFQQTLKKWLRRQPLARTLDDLQAQLDRFAHVYNHERPHQGIGRRTPFSRWQTGTPAQPAGHPLEHPTFTATAHESRVTAAGKVIAGGFHIQLGVEWQGRPARPRCHWIDVAPASRPSSHSCFRSLTTSSSTSTGVCPGHDTGRRDRGSSPSSPSSRTRCTHL